MPVQILKKFLQGVSDMLHIPEFKTDKQQQHNAMIPKTSVATTYYSNILH